MIHLKSELNWTLSNIQPKLIFCTQRASFSSLTSEGARASKSTCYNHLELYFCPICPGSNRVYLHNAMLLQLFLPLNIRSSCLESQSVSTTRWVSIHPSNVLPSISPKIPSCFIYYTKPVALVQNLPYGIFIYTTPSLNDHEKKDHLFVSVLPVLSTVLEYTYSNICWVNIHHTINTM